MEWNEKIRHEGFVLLDLCGLFDGFRNRVILQARRDNGLSPRAPLYHRTLQSPVVVLNHEGTHPAPFMSDGKMPHEEIKTPHGHSARSERCPCTGRALCPYGVGVVPARGRRSPPTEGFTSPNGGFHFPQRS